MFYNNNSGTLSTLALSTVGTYLRCATTTSAPTFAAVAYSELSGTNACFTALNTLNSFGSVSQFL